MSGGDPELLCRLRGVQLAPGLEPGLRRVQGSEERVPCLSLGGLAMWVGVPRLSELAPALLQVAMPFCFFDVIAPA